MRTFTKATKFRKHPMDHIGKCEIENCNWSGVLYSYEAYEPGKSFAYDWLLLCPEHNQIFNPKGKIR